MAHGLLDYAVVAGMLAVPYICKFSKPVKKLYTAEALVLLGYIAVSDLPVSLKRVIPYKTHQKIDTLNVLQFAMQSFYKIFQKDKTALAFNIGLTAVAGTVVALTDWKANPA